MKVLYVFRGNIAGKALKKGAGKVPDDFLYGWNYLTNKNMFTDYVLAPRENRRSFLRWLTYLVELPFSLLTNTGFPIDIYIQFRHKINEADIIFCVNDAIGLGILFWKKLGFIKGKVIFISQSLSERKKIFRDSFIFFLVKSLVLQAHHVLTLSLSAKTIMENEYGVSPSKSSVFYFGVDENFWKPNIKYQTENFLLSVGNDLNRDYQSLIKAVHKDYRLIVVTKHKILIEPSQNIEVLNNLTDQELRLLYQRARVVIVPSKKVETESSGLSVTLQAMACGTPVIVSYSPALLDYVDGESSGCLFYEPENTAELKSVIRRVLLDDELRDRLSLAAKRNARKFISKAMADQVEDLVRKS